MKRLILNVVCVFYSLSTPAQNVGIGINTPQAGLHITHNDGLIASGTLGQGADLALSGSGTRMMWYSKKAALRAGSLGATGADFWDHANIGNYSVALGLNVKASGHASVAIGEAAQATKLNAMALGYATQANGNYSLALGGNNVFAKEQFSVAIGNSANANSFGAVAIGRNVNAGYSTSHGQNAYAIGIGETLQFQSGGHYATGDRSFVYGNNCRAVANGSFAFGNGSTAGQEFFNPSLGINSYAFGNSCRASGNFSFAFGNNANTNQRTGSMVFAARTDGIAVSTDLDHHMLAQFAGGYHFQTNTDANMGVYLQPNGNAWLSFCDRNMKEQFLPLNDEEVLKKISAINYSSWKYKSEPDPKNRHYGVMAQDFYAAFGQDELGNIGSDTLVNPIDMLGIAFSAIKALEKRTQYIDALIKENALLKEQLKMLEMQVSSESK